MATFGDDYLKWGTLPGLFGAFDDQPNPANSAMPYYDQIPGMLGGYFNPYIQAGANARTALQGQYGADLGLGNNLRSAYGSMMNNPGALMGKIGAGFKQSPGYQFQVNQALGAANRAAAAGGMEGTPEEQQNIAGVTNNLANQDYYNYLNHGLNIYNQGLSGKQGLYNQGIQGDQGLNNMGWDASRGLGEDIAQAIMSQGNLAYNGQVNQNTAEAGKWPMLAGMVGTAFGAGMDGGYGGGGGY